MEETKTNNFLVKTFYLIDTFVNLVEYPIYLHNPISDKIQFIYMTRDVSEVNALRCVVLDS